MKKLSKVRRVSRDIAKNPIARAVARANLRKVVFTYNVKLRMMAHGEVIKDEISDISRYLTLTIVGAGHDKVFEPECRELDSVLHALTRMSDNGFKLDRNEVTDICDAIDVANWITERLTPEAVRFANREIDRMFENAKC